MKAKRGKKKGRMDANSIGVNLRVTAHSNQGGRKYMEDMFCVAYQPTSDEKDLLYAYFGIFDGHGGREAAMYAKTHLMDHIVQQKNFWSDDDDLVLRAIREGFISVHQAMWRELDKWPKTQSGLPSTSGTTASVAFVRKGKLYIGHVGDSGIILGYKDPNSNFWRARPLTNDHKPESPAESARIKSSGGKVVTKSGVPRVVWNRPRIGHKGPVRRSTLIDEIPFLAVARSLGDLWSYNSEQDQFVVSPVPDTSVIEIDVNSHRCLILGSDGLWNMLTPQDAVNSVYFAEKHNENQQLYALQQGITDTAAAKANWMNPSKRLVDRALDRWYANNLRADNTSVVTVVIDPPGPPKVSPDPNLPTLSPRFKAVYTRYLTTNANRGASSESPVSPSTARASMVNTKKPSPLIRDIPQERSNRRKKALPKLSSKTSRVLLRDLIESGYAPSETVTVGPTLNMPMSGLPTVGISRVNDPAVQINEISSSCESFRTQGAVSSKTVHGSAVPDVKRKRGRPRKSPPILPVQPIPVRAPLKRPNRQSESQDDPASQRKIRKVATENTLRLSSQAVKGTAGGSRAAMRGTGGVTGLGVNNTKSVVVVRKYPRMRAANGKWMVSSKNTKPESKKARTKTAYLQPVLPAPPRRNALPNLLGSLNELLTDKSSDSGCGEKSIASLELLTSKLSKVGESSANSRMPQRVIRPPRKLQDYEQPKTCRDRYTRLGLRKKQEKATATAGKSGAASSGGLFDTSLPSDFTACMTPKQTLASKHTSKRLTGMKSDTTGKGMKLANIQPTGVGRSGKTALAKEAFGKKTSGNDADRKGRVTRSKNRV